MKLKTIIRLLPDVSNAILIEMATNEINNAGKKRPAADSDEKTTPAKKSSWNKGLLASMSDPNLLVKSDDEIVIIKDKYPKVSQVELVGSHYCPMKCSSYGLVYKDYFTNTRCMSSLVDVP